MCLLWLLHFEWIDARIYCQKSASFTFCFSPLPLGPSHFKQPFQGAQNRAARGKEFPRSETARKKKAVAVHGGGRTNAIRFGGAAFFARWVTANSVGGFLAPLVILRQRLGILGQRLVESHDGQKLSKSQTRFFLALV